MKSNISVSNRKVLQNRQSLSELKELNVLMVRGFLKLRY